MSGGQGGNSATTVNVPDPSGVLETLVGGGLFALKRAIVCWTFPLGTFFTVKVPHGILITSLMWNAEGGIV